MTPSTTESPAPTEAAARLAEQAADQATEVVWRPLEPAVERLVQMGEDLVAFLPQLAVGLLLFFVFLRLARWVEGWQRPFERLSDNPFLQELGRQAARTGVLLLGALLALEIMDATTIVGAVLGTAGLAGLAVSFAFKDLVENYIAGILLSLRQPFTPNDLVDIDGREGKVVRLTTRATILLTLEGNHLRIPNAAVFKGVIVNYTRNPRRRLDFAVGVGVEEDLLAVQREGQATLAALAGVLADPPPWSEVEALADWSVTVRFYAWVDQTDAAFVPTRSEAIRRVKERLDALGVAMPEPTYRILRVEPGSPDQSEDEDRVAGDPVDGSGSPRKRLDRGATGDGDADPMPENPEGTIERQIAEERHRDESSKEDLLSPDAPLE